MRLLVIRSKATLKIKGRATLVIKIGDRISEKALRDIDSVLVIGSGISIDSAVPPSLSLHNIPLAILAKDSISILMNPIVTRYNNYRRLQYQLDKIKALSIALRYIEAKIKGMINILKYHGVEPPNIPAPPQDIEDADTYEAEIRLWESTASSLLWSNLQSLLDPNILEKLHIEYSFKGRKPRHPDPFNKTLSVMYATIYSLTTKALIAAGLDPTYGFLHRTRYSTPLTFDYSEMFKPIAIEATISLINNEGLPELDEGELTRPWVNTAIKYLYDYLTLKHKDTKKTPYQHLYLKAFCLAKHLEGKCREDRLTVVWSRAQYRRRKRT
ncbi:MAG: CRISPR-associated endonuclease Cas1 [Desulfurococcales archaeon]|nr:CRISPR-associated endonuclease Cas1 [Desulfurococcales archaeon]